jgi:predicted secreted protein
VSLTAALGIYFVIWWTVLFAVLPWGIKSQQETEMFERGTDPGAPHRPLLLRKMVATTLVSAVLFVIVYAVWVFGLVPFDRIPLPFVLPSQQ